jgi:FKBP-type peptidyl-prolyl cis-trans isomerase
MQVEIGDSIRLVKICSSLVAGAFLLALFGCGSTNSAHTSKPKATTTTTTAGSEKEGGYPVPEAPPHEGRLEKLVVKDVKRGTGPVARWGDEVTVRYVGLVYQTADVYSQHWKGVDPLVFKLDHEAFGIGWQKGIEGMRVGGRRELLIPKHLLFEDEDVAYVVELLSVNKSQQLAKKPPSEFAPARAFAAIKWVEENKPHFHPSGKPAPKQLLFRDLEKGSGPAAKRGDEVDVFYAGAVYKTGELRYGGSTQPFPLGSGGLGGAFERGLEGMEPGGRRELIIPSRLLDGTPAIDYVIRMESVKPAGK